MIEQNKREFEIVGIPVWHEKGYTGKGIKIAEIEDADPALWFFDGNLNDPFSRANGKKDWNNHGQKVFDVMHQVAPGAELYMLPGGINTSNNTISGSFTEKTLKYAIENGIHIINASLGGIDNDKLNEEILKVQDQGAVFVTSGGNDGSRGPKGFAKSNVWISVAAVHLQGRNEEIERPSYSSIGEALDFSSFSNLYIHDARNNQRVFPVQGTSFSSPLLAGMLALVQQFFKEKVGRTLYQDEIYLFIEDNCIDLERLGFDEYTGHGLFVLPDPDIIDCNKYMLRGIQEEEEIVASKITMDVPATIIDGRFCIPTRFIAEATGGKAEWDSDTETGTFNIGNITLKATLGSYELAVEED